MLPSQDSLFGRRLFLLQFGYCILFVRANSTLSTLHAVHLLRQFRIAAIWPIYATVTQNYWRLYIKYSLSCDTYRIRMYRMMQSSREMQNCKCQTALTETKKRSLFDQTHKNELYVEALLNYKNIGKLWCHWVRSIWFVLTFVSSSPWKKRREPVRVTCPSLLSCPTVITASFNCQTVWNLFKCHFIRHHCRINCRHTCI